MPVKNEGLILDQHICTLPQISLTREWLETNGMGSYAASTIVNCHTRRYHGLLVVNLGGKRGRYVLLSKLEDSLRIEDKEYFLSCHKYPGLFFPGPQICLENFATRAYPIFTYRIGELTVVKSLLLLYQRNTVMVRYEIKHAPPSLTLQIRPFFAFRDFHALKKADPALKGEPEILEKGVFFKPYIDLPGLYLQMDQVFRFRYEPLWYYNFEYEEEKNRGYDWHEDLFTFGLFEITPKKGKSLYFTASLEEIREKENYLWFKEAKRRKRKIFAFLPPTGDEDIFYQLFRAADQFLIKQPDGQPTIIAGYPWFGTWGRDTLISLMGLTFLRGRTKEGWAILTGMGKYEKEGLLPNFFGHNGEDLAYNSVDSSLWYIIATKQAYDFTGNLKIIKEQLWPLIKKIITHFQKGTLFNIYMTAEGLLHAGDPNTNLTWMDARIDDTPVTPRWGFAVEINALWYNALCFTQELAPLLSDEPPVAQELIARLRTSFLTTFWLEKEGYLADLSQEGRPDKNIRPNQLFALSLPYPLLDNDKAKMVLAVVQEHLLTPYGIRTLSPQAAGYKGRYEGNEIERNRAYHQGTVWPWLIGPFGEAYLKFAEDKARAKEFLFDYLRNFLSRHLPAAGIGSLSEIFDGDPPHTPRGCPAQAWSVAEIIRLYYLLQRKEV